LLVGASVGFVGWGLTVVTSTVISHPVEALLLTVVLTALTMAWIWIFPERRDRRAYRRTGS
jgi:hypothetical protein